MEPEPTNLFRVPHAAPPPGGRVCLRLGGRDLIIVNVNGRFVCMDSVCSHFGGPLGSGDIEELGGRLAIKCSWHNYRFDLMTGELLESGLDGQFRAVRKAQRMHPVDVGRDGHLYVRIESPVMFAVNPLPSDKYQNHYRPPQVISQQQLQQQPHQQQPQQMSMMSFGHARKSMRGGRHPSRAAAARAAVRRKMEEAAARRKLQHQQEQQERQQQQQQQQSNQQEQPGMQPFNLADKMEEEADDDLVVKPARAHVHSMAPSGQTTMQMYFAGK